MAAGMSSDVSADAPAIILYKYSHSIISRGVARVARSGPEKAPFARYTRFLAGAAKIIALR